MTDTAGHTHDDARNATKRKADMAAQETAQETAQDTPQGTVLLPGSPQAEARGCCCSRLANASYRIGATSTPLLDPACALHWLPDTTEPKPNT